MKTVKEIKDLIGEKTEARMALVNTARTESRGLTTEERAKHATLTKEIEDLNLDLPIAQADEQDVAVRNITKPLFVHGSPAPNLGNEQKRDLSKYSVMKALATVADKRSLSGIELEMHQEAEKEVRSFGEDLGGIGVPSWYAAEKRAASAGVAAAGGYTIQTDLGNLIDVVYDEQFTSKLGARKLSGLTGNIALPTSTAKLTVAEYAENAPLTPSDLTFGQVTLSPVRDGAETVVSKLLLIQSTIDVEAYIADMLKTQFVLFGELRAYTKIMAAATELTIAASTNGIAPAYAHLLAQEQALAVANIRSEFGYLTNPKVRTQFKNTTTLANTVGMPVWDTDCCVAGYKTAVSNIVPSNLVKGSSGAVCSAAIMGDFKEFVTGYWGGMDYIVDPYTYASNGQVKIVAQMFSNGLVTRAAAFSKISQYLTV